jgi:uncharacterized membrane protein YeaQ/YmgE (transglycosylase-associated protein family)
VTIREAPLVSERDASTYHDFWKNEREKFGPPRIAPGRRHADPGKRPLDCLICINTHAPRPVAPSSTHIPVQDMPVQDRSIRMSIIWTIIIGFIVGMIARFIMPGDKEPSGFIMTTILGIVGAFVATYLGQAVGWYRPGESAGFIGGIVGAVIVLFIYGLIVGRQRSVTR